MNTAKTALITGSRGFVGAELCELLVARGWELQNQALRLFQDPGGWQDALRATTCVVHLAARVHRLQDGPDAQALYHETNVEGSRFVAEQAVSARITRFVYLSSIKVNGEGTNRPYRPTDEPSPQDAYGNSKLAAERIISEICDRAKIEFVIIRPPLIVGPGVKANFRRLIEIANLGLPLPLASIRNQRSLLGLSNLVDFIETCMVHPSAAGRTWLVSDQESLSTPELLRRIAKLMNRKSRLFGFPPTCLRAVAYLLGLNAQMARLCDSLTIDASAAHLELGWQPRRSLDWELTRTVAAYINEKAR